ncbi:hypothetical protein AQUCO_07400007v1 [Aquilegia coerulea]|uniref:LRAT domain-containing protein n=1 Tax=Aquilegia coerulea TaxID=218851 RepID=A0A2G5C9C0_AQUCA|nr:hypothetical protein AQUCO_07400007v1 [Aquilegia coerulea]
MGLFSNKVDRSQLQPGDHIYSYRKAQIYAHHGIYVEADRVIHYTNTKGGSGSYGSVSGKTSKRENQCKNCGHDQNVKRGVIKTCIDCFLSGHDLYRYEYGISFGHFLCKKPGTCTTGQSDPEDVVISRATNLLYKGFGDYHLFENNCECFAMFCKTCKHVSQQATYRFNHFKFIAMEWRNG